MEGGGERGGKDRLRTNEKRKETGRKRARETSRKDRAEGQASESGEAPRRTTINAQLITCGPALLRDECRAVAAVGHVDDAPRSTQPHPILSVMVD